MIPPKIKSLFQFIEFLHSNIGNFKQYDEVINELHLLDSERRKLSPRKNFVDKLKYDEVQEQIKDKFNLIQDNILQPIKAKADELKICDLNRTETLWNWNSTEIHQLKENFSKDDLPAIFSHKSKYLEYRTETKGEAFFGLDFFFDDLDEVLKTLFDYFKETEKNEFESFETKAIQVDDIGEAVKLFQQGHKKINLPDNFLDTLKVQQPRKIDLLSPQRIKIKELEEIKYLIGYWVNEDDTVIEKVLSEEREVVKDFVEPFSKELNINLLSKNTFEAKRDLIKYYIFEFWELQGYFKEYSEILFTGSYCNYTPVFYDHTSDTGAKRRLDKFENYVINSWQLFDMIFNEIQACCIKFNIDFFDVCSELNFSTKLVDVSTTLEFEKMQKDNLPPAPITKQKPELNRKLITFKNSETIEKVHCELKGYFPNKEAELLKALQGQQLDEFLLFPHNQNKFVEVFKRLKYNGYLLSTPKGIKEWICSTFTYQYQKSDKKEVREFNISTVHDILTKDKGEPTKNERICIVDWLPYKSHLTRQSEAQK